MSLEKLIIAQNTHIELIETAIRNYKKTAHAKRTKGLISARKEQIEKYWTTFTEYHMEIELLTHNLSKAEKDNIAYLSEDVYSTAEDKYYEFVALLNDALEAFEPTLNQSQTSNDSQQVPSNNLSHSLLKLPKISLPTFSESYSEWRSLSDLFISLIHSNSSISNVQKLHYLKSSVTGEAEHLLRQFQITESNYLHAWQTLQDRYQNKRVLVNTQLKTLFGQPSLQYESANGVKSLIDRTSECL